MQEKDKLKVKEKLNKCNKDRLLDLSDLLDVYTLRVHSKKVSCECCCTFAFHLLIITITPEFYDEITCYISQEDISAKLMEFLESPHVTREVMLSEKVKVYTSSTVKIRAIKRIYDQIKNNNLDFVSLIKCRKVKSANGL